MTDHACYTTISTDSISYVDLWPDIDYSKIANGLYVSGFITTSNVTDYSRSATSFSDAYEIHKLGCGIQGINYHYHITGAHMIISEDSESEPICRFSKHTHLYDLVTEFYGDYYNKSSESEFAIDIVNEEKFIKFRNTLLQSEGLID